jgi:Tol biopolymer transport system component
MLLVSVAVILTVSLLAVACTGRPSEIPSNHTPLPTSVPPSRSAATEAEAPPESGARIVATDGQLKRSVPNLPADTFDVDLSPDGRTIAFARRRAGTSRIYTMAIDGTALRRLPHKQAFGPAWSPDGRSIAYTGSSRGGALDIFVVPADGGRPVRMTSDADVDELQPSWSPDGAQIAFAAPVAHGATAWLPGQGIRILDLASGRITQITDKADSMPAWSPRGDQIAFLRQPDPVMGGYRLKLIVADTDGTHHRAIFHTYRFNSHLRWSPDGTELSATATRNDPPWGVYVINVATGGAREVVHNAVGGDWLPTGQALLVRLTRQAATDGGCQGPPSGC